MKKPSWRARVFFRYVLFQVPSWSIWILVLILIRHWLDLPWWVIPGVAIPWVVKDIIAFPYVWRAYDSSEESRHPLLGAQGVVVRPLNHSGYIWIRGELWRAEVLGGRSIPKGETVRVQEVQGLTLVVQPAAPHPDRRGEWRPETDVAERNEEGDNRFFREK